MLSDSWDLILRIAGWLGALEVIAAYTLISLQRISPKSAWYMWLNFSGSILLIINTAYLQSYPSMLINIVWAIVAIVALIKHRQYS